LLCVTHQGVDINVSQCSSINFTMAIKFDTGEIHKSRYKENYMHENISGE